MVYATFRGVCTSAEAVINLLHDNFNAIAEEESNVGMIRSFDYLADGRTVRMDVLGYDIDELAAEGKKPEHTATLQMHFLTDEEIPFCDRNRPDIDKIKPNAWSTSTIRQRLNDEEFIEEHFGELAEHIVPVRKHTEYDEETIDKVFLLSKEEISQADSPYPFYANDPESRARVTVDGEPDYYRLRSANRGYAYIAWYVSSGGGVSTGTALSATRALPSLVIDIS